MYMSINGKTVYTKKNTSRERVKPRNTYENKNIGFQEKRNKET
jgi:hypothetical protein